MSRRPSFSPGLPVMPTETQTVKLRLTTALCQSLCPLSLVCRKEQGKSSSKEKVLPESTTAVSVCILWPHLSISVPNRTSSPKEVIMLTEDTRDLAVAIMKDRLHHFSFYHARLPPNAHRTILEKSLIFSSAPCVRSLIRFSASMS